MQGWITWFSWISLLAGVINIAANVTTTIVTQSFPSYVVQGWHTILIMYAYIIVLGLVNSFMFWIVPYVEVFSGILHITLWIVFAAVLLTLAPKHTTEFVFFEKSNLSGWNSDFVSFNLGIQLITWGFVGAHLSLRLAQYNANSTQGSMQLPTLARRPVKPALPSLGLCSGPSA